MDKNILLQFARDIYSLTLLFPKKEPLRWRLRDAVDEAAAGYILKQNDWYYGLALQLELIDDFLRLAADQNWQELGRIADLNQRCAQIRREIEWEKPAPAPDLRDFSNPRGNQSQPDCFHMPAAEKLTLREGIDVDHQLSPAQTQDNKTKPAQESVEFMPLAAQDETAVRPDPDDPEGLIEEDGDAERSGPPDLTDSQTIRQNRILEFLKEKGNAQVWEIQKIFPNISKRTIRRDFKSLLRQGIIERTGERNTIAYKIKISLS